MVEIGDRVKPAGRINRIAVGGNFIIEGEIKANSDNLRILNNLERKGQIEVVEDKSGEGELDEISEDEDEEVSEFDERGEKEEV